MDSKTLAKLPEVIEVEKQLTEIHNAAVEVSSAAEAQEAAALLQRIRAAAKRIEDLRTSITGPINASLKAVNAFFRVPADNLAERQKAVSNALRHWQAAEQARVDEANRIAREKAAAERAEAQRLADIEAARILAEAVAETERLQRIADRNRRMAEAAGDNGGADIEAQALESEHQAAAVQAAAATQVAAAQRQAIYTPPPIEQRVQKVAGFHTREVWKWRVVDAAAIPVAYLQINDGLLNELARIRKSDAAVPGIEFYRDSVGVTR